MLTRTLAVVVISAMQVTAAAQAASIWDSHETNVPTVVQKPVHQFEKRFFGKLFTTISSGFSSATSKVAIKAQNGYRYFKPAKPPTAAAPGIDKPGSSAVKGGAPNVTPSLNGGKPTFDRSTSFLGPPKKLERTTSVTTGLNPRLVPASAPVKVATEAAKKTGILAKLGVTKGQLIKDIAISLIFGVGINYWFQSRKRMKEAGQLMEMQRNATAATALAASGKLTKKDAEEMGVIYEPETGLLLLPPGVYVPTPENAVEIDHLTADVVTRNPVTLKRNPIDPNAPLLGEEDPSVQGNPATDGTVPGAPLGSTTAPLASTTAPLGSTTAPLGSTTAPLGSTTAPLGSTTAPLSSTTPPPRL